MRRPLLLGLFIPLLTAAYGCEGDVTPSGEATAEIEAAIDVAAPLPAGWTGSKVDLLVADAWASCSYKAKNTTMASSAEMDASDEYLTKLESTMNATACSAAPAGAGTFDRWVKLRGTATCNSLPDGTTKAVTLDQTVIPPRMTGNAEIALRTAETNYCIAQTLRMSSPGASTLQALGFSHDEQRRLLEQIRERSQIAMLEYGLLGLAFNTTSTAKGLLARYGVYTEVAGVRDWAANPANADALKAMGNDFAGAIQLNVAATEDIAQLFAHAAASHAPRGGPLPTPVDDTWGPGSWRQRLLAFLYGGDALVQQTANAQQQAAPLQHPTGKVSPGTSLPIVYAADSTGQTNARDLLWPTKSELPYATVDVVEPRVDVLFSLAKQNDVVDIKQGSALASVAGSVGTCYGNDIPASAKALYRNLEAALRTRQCEVLDAAGACTTVTAASLPDETTGYTDFLLWKEHRFSPNHATLLMAQLDDWLGDYCPSGASHPQARYGALDVDGSVGVPSAGVRHIGAQTHFAVRPLPEVAPRFSRLAHFQMPRVIDYAGSLEQQGLLSSVYVNHAESKRALGAIGALTAVRESLDNGYHAGTNGSAFYTLRGLMLDVISSAIGDTSVGIAATPTAVALGRPAGFFGPDISPRQPAVMAHAKSGSALQWDVNVTTPADDPWWQVGDSNRITIVAIANDPLASGLALHPASSRDGRSLATMATNAPASAKLTAADVLVGAAGASRDLVHWHFTVPLPTGQRWTFVARKDGATPDYRLVAGNVSLLQYNETCDGSAATDPGTHSYYTATSVPKERPLEGQYLSFGGTLGTVARRTMEPDAVNPVEPAFDGFGLRRRWVPNPDPRYFEASAAAQTLVDYYIAQAHQDEQAATAAVKQAIDNQLKLQLDETTKTAVAAKSGTAIQLNQRELCGVDNRLPPIDTSTPACDTNTSETKLDFTTVLAPAPTCPATAPDDSQDPITEAANMSASLDCLVADMLSKLSINVVLANPVRDTMNAAQEPDFARVSGGTLQKAWGDQWSAIRTAQNLAAEVVTANTAAKARIAQFIEAKKAAQKHADDNCSDDAMGKAVAAGISAGVSTGFASATVSVNFSPGPLIAQKQKCSDLTTDLAPAQAAAVAAMWEGMSSTAAQLSKLSQAAHDVLDASAKVLQLQNAAQVANARENMEAQFATATLQTSFGLWREVRNADIQEAQRLLSKAQMSAITARRAIESRYVVDLSRMYAPEGPLASPATWADSIYGLDLDLAAAVGYDVGSNSAVSVYPYSVKQYVDNLDSFVRGYFNNGRDSRYGSRDAIIDIVAPYTTDTSGAAAWTVCCPGSNNGNCADDYGPGTGGTWVSAPTSGELKDACGGARPVRAKVVFSLDPWGRLGMDVAHPPLAFNYNMRWTQLAVNLRGSTVHDCTMANAPQGCQVSHVDYNLTHVAPAWTTDYNESWKPLGFLTSTVEAAPGVTAGLTWTEQSWSSSADGPAAKAAAIREYTDRAMGGVYELDINPFADPSVNIQYIDGVQILLTYNYWQRLTQ